MREVHQILSVKSYDLTLFLYIEKRLHTFCTPFAQPAFLCIKRRNFRRTRLSSTPCVRLRPSAGWLQGSLCRRFLLPPAFRFAGAGVLPGSGLAGPSPGIPYKRSCGFQGATGKTATKKPSQNRSALPSLFLEGHASRLCNG